MKIISSIIAAAFFAVLSLLVLLDVLIRGKKAGIDELDCGDQED